MVVSPFDYEAALFACAQGDQDALQDLYQHESPRMLALCLKMLAQRTIAEDLMRDTFVSIWKHANSYDPGLGAGRAWMYSILRYRALHRLRLSRPAQSLDMGWTEKLPDTGGDHSPSSTILDAIAALDEAQRRPLLMAFYNGYTYEQIAARLDAPAAHIKQCVQTGLNRIVEQQPV
ncbi:RNA polymerase subunit sigma [Pollutimonas nitritireducens]|uniref:RNA polymerase subunit sigma n=1 Tax=Pollutimonas nitritireducens TaxID=2045209 RepID=A0A2N4UC65_9BURK|nr:sigma-70 family RNA polymerase sigma factor [Pollutimonas nitritireducens]PLC52601.1 RNA polymerase subunit sigma [Pollutimonas nitritireducens]